MAVFSISKPITSPMHTTTKRHSVVLIFKQIENDIKIIATTNCIFPLVSFKKKYLTPQKAFETDFKNVLFFFIVSFESRVNKNYLHYTIYNSAKLYSAFVPYQLIFRLPNITNARMINKPILPTSNAASSNLINTKMNAYKQAKRLPKTLAVFKLLK